MLVRDNDKQHPFDDESCRSLALTGVLEQRLQRLREAFRSRSIAPKVLDFGCGRGEFVAWLCKHGFDGYGVDIAGTYIDAGRESLLAMQVDPLRLQAIAPEGRTGFPDGSFDLIITRDVFEHVEDRYLRSILVEMKRLCGPEGTLYHEFPARWGLFEVHLRQPIVHWLPKNELRRLAISLFLRLGWDPDWRFVPRGSRSERIDYYFRYCNGSTFYRSTAAYARLLEELGFDCVFSLKGHKKLNDPLLGRLYDGPIGRGVVEWLVMSFSKVYLQAATSSENADPSSSPWKERFTTKSTKKHEEKQSC